MLFTTILGVITGLAGPISSIVGKIEDRKIALAKAESDTERNKILGEIEELHGRQSVLVAEAGSRIAGAINAIMRAYIAIGPASYIAKYYFWDKVIGSFVGCAGPHAPVKGCEIFTTDGLTPSMAGVMTAVVAFYFLYNWTAQFRR